MRTVLLYSLLLVAGLFGSQVLPHAARNAIELLAMFCLAFIMIHVGYEFDIDKEQPRQYVVDYGVAATAAAFPWILTALYFVFAMAPREMWGSLDLWKEALLQGRFAAPTSAGVLFSMLAAAGLGATWVFAKARILAIFDDLDTILFMIPLKIMMVGWQWQLGVVLVVIVALLWLAWRYLHLVRLPVSWPFVMAYAAVIALVSEVIYRSSKLIDDSVPIHLEVLLPAFVLGCMLGRPTGGGPRAGEGVSLHHGASEQRVATLVAGSFMVLVGLVMPPMSMPSVGAAASPYLAYEGVSAETLALKNAFPGWNVIVLHVIAVTVLANVGKMFPAFAYRREARRRERLAVAFTMFPRGEVGAGVLMVSLSYGVSGPATVVAALSLALNLVLTAAIIWVVKRLIGFEAERA